MRRLYGKCIKTTALQLAKVKKMRISQHARIRFIERIGPGDPVAFFRRSLKYHQVSILVPHTTIGPCTCDFAGVVAVVATHFRPHGLQLDVLTVLGTKENWLAGRDASPRQGT